MINTDQRNRRLYRKSSACNREKSSGQRYLFVVREYRFSRFELNELKGIEEGSKMPQLPTSTAEEYGADDEIKEYRQEDDDGAENSNVDVVNDIKSDLKKDAEDQTLDSGKGSIDEGHFSGIHSERHVKGEAGVYGRPAAVIVGPHRYPPNYPPGCNSVSHTTPHHPVSYSSGTQIHMPVYGRDDRGAFYEHRGWHSPQVPIMGSPHGYTPYYASGPIPSKTDQGHIIYDYRHAPHHGMIPPNSGVIAYPGSGPYSSQPLGKQAKEKKITHVKKPLNAFMLYMKEMRPKIAAECTLKESAAINQILGKRWHALDRSEQAKYYEMARKERAIHMQMYPGWTARDNYAQLGRKKKRRKDKNQELNPKKCRARYGLDRQDQWCKPCRRKKKCIRFVAGAEGNIEAEEENEAPRSDGSSVGDQDVGQISDLKEEISDSPPTMVEGLSEDEPSTKASRSSPTPLQSPSST